MKIGTEVIQNSSSVKLLGNIIVIKLNFNEHVTKSQQEVTCIDQNCKLYDKQ